MLDMGWLIGRENLRRTFQVIILVRLVVGVGLPILADRGQRHEVVLPTGKVLNVPAPGYIGFAGSFPGTVTLSPDGRYAALLNYGFGTRNNFGRQSITIFDLITSEIQEFPDHRLGLGARQTYFLGLAFASSGTRQILGGA